MTGKQANQGRVAVDVFTAEIHAAETRTSTDPRLRLDPGRTQGRKEGRKEGEAGVDTITHKISENKNIPDRLLLVE